MTKRWDDYFLDLALTTARMSKDPDTQVGAVIVGPDREVLSIGFNGLPRGVVDTALRRASTEKAREVLTEAGVVVRELSR